MAQPIQDFIQQYLGFQQFMEQQRQFNQQEVLQQRQLENAEIQNFLGIAQQVQNPADLGPLAAWFGERTGNPEMFMSLAGNVAPLIETQRAGLAQEGLQGLDPEARANVGAQTAIRAVTGMSRGQNFVDEILANRDPDEVQQSQRIGEGLAPSWEQEDTSNLRWSGDRRAERALTQEGALREADLILRGTVAATQAQLDRERMGLARSQAEAEAEQNAVTGGMTLKQIIDAQQAALDDWMQASNPAQKSAAVHAYNVASSMMAASRNDPFQTLIRYQPRQFWFDQQDFGMAPNPYFTQQGGQ